MLFTVVRDPSLQRGLDRQLGWAQSTRPTAVYTGLPRPHLDVKYAYHVWNPWGGILTRKEPRTLWGACQWAQAWTGVRLLPPPISHLRDRGAVPFPLGRARCEWEGAVSSEGVTLSLRILPVRQALGETGRPVERISPRWSLVLSGVSPAQPCGQQGLSFFFGPVPCTAGPLVASRGSTH